MKVCTKCGEEKPLEEFTKDKRKKSGRKGECYECKRKRDNARNRERGMPEFVPAKPKCSRIWIRVCEETGALFVARRKKQVRCKQGQRVHELNKGRKNYYKHRDEYLLLHKIKWYNKNNNRIRECKLCGKEYDFLIKGTVGFCSGECRDKARRAYNNSTKNHRKRARHFNVEYEYINKLKVFRRDKWKCQMCGCKVQYGKHLKDNAAELDHIIPMSKGGGHLYSNVQTLCRKCNNEKGNKLIGQLRIAI